MSLSPFLPPCSSSAPKAGGVIGSEPEDFLVEEVPAYPLSGDGEHVFLWVEKRGLTTPELAKRIARAGSARERDVGFAGLKDKNAITRQWFSLCTKDEGAKDWDLGDDSQILEVTRHQNKLRTGHLIGNRFVITLSDVPDGGLERAQVIAQELSNSGQVNYFGPQRFGHGGRNLARAFEWLADLEGKGNTPASSNESGDAAEEAADVPKRKSRRRKKPNARFENKMLPSVLQSELFNRYASVRLALPDELLLGEAVRLDGSKKCFIVEDVEKELPRFRSGDLHRTGSLIGPKTLASEQESRRLEVEIENDLGLTEAQLELLGKHAPGARRDLLLHPEALAVEQEEPGRLKISFILPSGSYATQLIREFTGAAWDSPRG